MIYSKEERAHRGQGFRDRVRCEAVENMKGNDRYNVYSLDNKHSEDLGQEGIIYINKKIMIDLNYIINKYFKVNIVKLIFLIIVV